MSVTLYTYITAERPDSVVGTGWTVRGSNPGGGRDFSHLSSLLYNGYRVFHGGKVQSRRDTDSSPASSAEVKNRVELYLYSP